MNISSLDLNLIVAFDAVERERNVTRAASRIGITQPAMSNALARLRKAFNDPLFVRTRHGMKPTPLAQKLAKPIRRACTYVNDALMTVNDFEPRLSTRSFAFYMSDIGEVVNLPIILRHLQTAAPLLSIKVSRIPQRDVQEAMEAGEVDIALGLFPSLTGGFYEQRLYRDTFACIARVDHPSIGDAITRKQFSEASHGVVVSPGTGHDAAVERILVRQRITRHVALRVPHFMALPAVVSQTDLIATLPLKAAKAFCQVTQIKILDPPLKIPGYDIKQYWHERFHHDAANRWMRSQLARLFLEAPVELSCG